MATVILQSQNCLRERFRKRAVVPLPLRSRRTSNSNPIPKSTPNACTSNPSTNPSSSLRSMRRKRVNATAVDAVKSAAKNLVMGQVTILKRGEKLAPPPRVAGSGRAARGKRSPSVRAVAAQEKELALSSTERLGPEPEAVQKHIKVSELNNYAGSAFVESPPPSSLPLPAFTTKNEPKIDVATSDLRRLLRLDVFMD